LSSWSFLLAAVFTSKHEKARSSDAAGEAYCRILLLCRSIEKTLPGLE